MTSTRGNARRIMTGIFEKYGEVEEAVRLNKELTYINLHQKCIVSTQEDDIKKLQTSLVEVRGQLKNTKDKDTPLIELRSEVAALKKQIEMLKDENSRVQAEETASKSKYNASISQLEEAHKVMERHLHNSECYRREVSALETDLSKTREELERLKQTVDRTTKDLNVEKQVHEEAINAWKEKEAVFRKQVEDLETELTSQKQINADLEELNTNWAQQNVQLNKDLGETKALLNKPKKQLQVQTDLSLLLMSDSHSQTHTEVTHSQVQTDGSIYISTSCQTYVPVMVYGYTQTLATKTESQYSQTVAVEKSNTSVQTDIDLLSCTKSVSENPSHTDGKTSTSKAEKSCQNQRDIPDKPISNIGTGVRICTCRAADDESSSAMDVIVSNNQTLWNVEQQDENLKIQDAKGGECDEKCVVIYGGSVGLTSESIDQRVNNDQAVDAPSLNNQTVEKMESLNEARKENIDITVLEQSLNQCINTESNMNCSKPCHPDVLETNGLLKQSRNEVEEKLKTEVLVCAEHDEGNYDRVGIDKASPRRTGSKLKLMAMGKTRRDNGTGDNVIGIDETRQEGVNDRGLILPAVTNAGSKSDPISLQSLSQDSISDFILPVQPMVAISRKTSVVQSPIKSSPRRLHSPVGLSPKELQSPVKSSPRRCQLPILVETNRLRKDAKKEDKCEDMRENLTTSKGILKESLVTERRDKKTVTFGTVTQRDFASSSDAAEIHEVDDQYIIPDSDDDEDSNSIANRYKRTIQKIMRKSQAKKIKLE